MLSNHLVRLGVYSPECVRGDPRESGAAGRRGRQAAATSTERAVTQPAPHPDAFVSRGGLKLRHALDQFGLDVRGWSCADLGCSTGGFTDCLLKAGATRVICVDTGYGVLAWKLRNDPRVTVLERTNALHAAPVEQVDLVTIDMSWTPQRLALPAARAWLRPGGRVITLIKPHYEDKALAAKSRGVLADADAAAVTQRVLAELASADNAGWRTLGLCESPIRGGAKTQGNIEFLALVEPGRGDAV